MSNLQNGINKPITAAFSLHLDMVPRVRTRPAYATTLIIAIPWRWSDLHLFFHYRLLVARQAAPAGELRASWCGVHRVREGGTFLARQGQRADSVVVAPPSPRGLSLSRSLSPDAPPPCGQILRSPTWVSGEIVGRRLMG